MKRILSVVLVLTFLLTIASINTNSVSAASNDKTVYHCSYIYNILGGKIGEFCNKTRFYYNYDEVTSAYVYATGYRSLGSMTNTSTEKFRVNNDLDYQTSASGDLCIASTSWWKGLDCVSFEEGLRVNHDGTYKRN